MARVSLLSCGRCGKPRGLRHVCTGRRKASAWKPGLVFTCGTCGQRHRNPLTHQCVVKSDFRKRLAAQSRREKTQARRRKRRAAAARRKARARERKAEAAARRKQAAREKREREKAQHKPASHDPTRHPYQACADLDCGRYPCRVYREGKDAGRPEGHSGGYAEGYADGVQAGATQGGIWR
jgi:hypothetical protein